MPIVESMPQFQDRISRWIRKFPKAVTKAFKLIRPILINDIQRNYLSGQVLGVVTGNLRLSIEGIIVPPPALNLRIGTRVVSKKGFGYGAYWFYKGRDFLRPSINKNIGRMDKIILNQILAEYGRSG